MSSFDYQPSTIAKYRAGTIADPYIDINESKKIINNQIQLSEIPVKLNHVVVSGYTEVSDVETASLKTTEYLVDYNEGLVFFHSSAEGLTLTFVYKGRGNHYISANRVWTAENNGQVTETLGDIIASASAAIDNLVLLNATVTNAENATTAANNAATNTNSTNNVVNIAETARAAAELIRVSQENTRVSNETTRQTQEESRNTAETGRFNAEALRLASEINRVNTESSRGTNETARSNAEANRVSAETNRSNAESTRQSNETVRGGTETSRGIAETGRVTAETGRVNTEATRVSNELSRVSSESSRVTAETNRVNAESSRISAENTRGTAETSRSTAETSRANAESNRATAEANRITGETSRTVAESSRATNESARGTAESNRDSAESSRSSAESLRSTNDSNRTTAEDARVSSESARSFNETIRQNQETTRQTNTTDAINNLADLTSNTRHFSAFNAATAYVPNNIVSYNGSSYMNIMACTNILPTDNTKWQLIGSQGVQGIQGIQGLPGVKGNQWRNQYNNSTVYNVDDVVSNNGSSYICILASTGNLPTNTTYWSVFAQRGIDGAGTVASVTSPNGDIVVGGIATDLSITLNSGTGANQIPKLDNNGLISSDILKDGTTNKAYTTSEKTKLAGISTQANKTTSSSTNGNVLNDGTETVVYMHPSGDGNLHVPATSTTNDDKFLKAGNTPGSISWAVLAVTDVSGAAPLASPTLTGTPLSTTAVVDTNTTQIATTAFVIAQAASTTPIIDGVAAVGISTRFARADHVHASDTTKANLTSPTFTGTPAAPTATLGTNSTQIATTAFVLANAPVYNPLTSPALYMI